MKFQFFKNIINIINIFLITLSLVYCSNKSRSEPAYLAKARGESQKPQATALPGSTKPEAQPTPTSRPIAERTNIPIPTPILVPGVTVGGSLPDGKGSSEKNYATKVSVDQDFIQFQMTVQNLEMFGLRMVCSFDLNNSFFAEWDLEFLNEYMQDHPTAVDQSELNRSLSEVVLVITIYINKYQNPFWYKNDTKVILYDGFPNERLTCLKSKLKLATDKLVQCRKGPCL